MNASEEIVNPSGEGTSFDVIVVGAGIAGLTAAQTVAEHGARVVAVEKLAPGGQLINIGVVEGYPGLAEKSSGADFMGRLLEDAMAGGVEINYGEAVSVRADGSSFAVALEAETLHGRAVVAATGLTPGRLEADPSAAWSGKGVSECASCDGPLYRGRPVAVVGDDEWAAHEALELASLASHVVVLSPTTSPTWSASLGKRLGDQVEVRTGVRVSAVAGADVLSGLRLDDGSEVEVAGVFAFVGKQPRSEPFDDVLVRDESGRLHEQADRGLFVAGDVRSGSDPHLVAAAADGLRAGLAAARYLAGR